MNVKGAALCAKAGTGQGPQPHMGILHLWMMCTHGTASVQPLKPDLGFVTDSLPTPVQFPKLQNAVSIPQSSLKSLRVSLLTVMTSTQAIHGPCPEGSHGLLSSTFSPELLPGLDFAQCH